MSDSDIIIKVTDWSIDKNELSQIRRKVFIEEQNVPEDLEWDELDEPSTHFRITTDEKTIACARLTPAGQIGRMAVLPEYRKQGVGSQLLTTVLQYTQEMGLCNIFLHAQVSAIPFYVKHGFIFQGDIFSEAGIPHREMVKKPEVDNQSQLNTAVENRDVTLTLASQADHSIDIFTQDLDAAIYDNTEFERYIFELSKKHPTTCIRILTPDSGQAIRQGHSLIRLAQKLTSSVFIHNPSREHESENSAFMIVDKHSFLYRVTANNRNYEASFSINSPQRAGKLSDMFDEMWEHSTPDVQIRRIYL